MFVCGLHLLMDIILIAFFKIPKAIDNGHRRPATQSVTFQECTVHWACEIFNIKYTYDHYCLIHSALHVHKVGVF